MCTTKLNKYILNTRLESKGISIRLIDDYVNARTKLTFQCSNGHTWESKPDHILNSGSGCPVCYKERVYYSQESIIKILSKKGYTLLSKYMGVDKNIDVKCSEGHKWNTRAGHLIQGKGTLCPECSLTSGSKQRITKQIVNERILERGFKIVSNFKGAQHQSMFQCSEGHTWESDANHIMNGSNCPKCSNHGYNQNKPGILYYLNIKDTSIYKIGITNRTIQERFSLTELSTFNIIKTWKYDNGLDAMKIERFIKKHYKKYKYIGDNLLKSGNTELFNKDILGINQ